MNMDNSAVELRVIEGDMELALLTMANTSFSEYKFQCLTAASFMENETIVAWFNELAFHSAPLSLNNVHNAVVKLLFGSDHSIHLTNKPLPFLEGNYPLNGVIIWKIFDEVFAHFLSVIVYMMMSIYSAKYVMFYVEVCILCRYFDIKTGSWYKWPLLKPHRFSYVINPNVCALLF